MQTGSANYIAQAQALAALIAQKGISQEQAARKLGVSQSAVANKLRLLRFSPQVRAALTENGLCERHARALLRVEGEAAQLRLIDRIAEEGWSVAQLEAYLDEAAPPRGARLLLGAVEHALASARCAGLAAGLCKAETEREIVLTIRVAK